MAKWISLAFAIALASGAWADSLPSRPQHAIAGDAAVATTIIKMSLDRYHSHGPCACPYDTDRDGNSCGRRSAYSRPNGYAPICYATDVTPGMIQDFRDGKFKLIGS